MTTEEVGSDMAVPELVWGREMSPVDYLMFRGEVDPRMRSSMMSVEILDRVPDWQRLRDAFDRASRVVLRLRQRVVAPTMPIGTAQWVVDPDFDLDYHLRRIRSPEPGTLRQVLDVAQPMLSAPLDMARPLWEVTLVEGVTADGGQAALLTKLSHSIADGLGAVEMDRQLRDFEREADRGPMPPLPVPEDVTSGGLTRRGLRRLPLSLISGIERLAVGGLGLAGRVARSPTGAASEVAGLVGSVQRILGAPPVEPSPLLRRRSLNRRLDSLDVPLADLRTSAKAFGCSVNDAYIAALCGGLRLYHERLGVPVDAVPMAIPVSLRTADDPAGGNRWAGVRLAAPVGEPDPIVRMRAVRELMLTARSERGINVINAVAPVLARAPAELLSMLSSMGLSNDVQASNVPGHAQPTYMAGARILRMCPFGPLPGAAMMVVMFSLADTCFIGVHYDTASVTEPDLFARCLREGFDEVIALGRPSRSRSAGQTAVAASTPGAGS
ncbi:MAG TPA: wax ester/triacylglycerol synthase family O-acyltransferase [Acidimicrobiales bacterium]|nr:wax ester/triacylglycerol synthase family O-acyltransferase [Acidimicrobiales bacterium]